MLVVTCLGAAGDFLRGVSCSARDVSIQAAAPGVVVLLRGTMQGWDIRKSRYVLVVPPQPRYFCLSLCSPRSALHGTLGDQL